MAWLKRWWYKNKTYAGYIWRHKVAVYRAGRMLGVGRWQLICHDLSKLRRDEWGPYAHFFNGGPHKPWAQVTSYEKMHYYDMAWRSSAEGVREAFDRAWLNHQHRNPHHWQSWLLVEDSGERVLLEMPLKYAREMLADWMGAGMAIRGHGLDDAIAETRLWYGKKRDVIVIGDATRAFVESTLGVAGAAPTE